MSFDSHAHVAPARRTRRPAGRGRSRVIVLLALLCAFVPAGQAAAAQPPAEHAQEHAAPGHEAAAEHAEGPLPTVARVLNFAILAGVLFYFLKVPIATYLASRSTQIRQDLVTAAEMRAAATAQLAQIEAKMQSLPAELDALRAQGAEDVVAERARISRAAGIERERLLEHTRREIAMQLRVARRELVEHAAQLAVDVARARILRTITPEDQLRLVDRYAAQLKEAQ
jgi:F-type H+-transporting ATPase subunit b